MACSGRGAPALVAYHACIADGIEREGIDEMDTTLTLVRLQVKGRARARMKWRVYRWIGVCAMLAIACLIMLSLVF